MKREFAFEVRRATGEEILTLIAREDEAGQLRLDFYETGKRYSWQGGDLQDAYTKLVAERGDDEDSLWHALGDALKGILYDSGIGDGYPFIIGEPGSKYQLFKNN